jgi:hypothetical protein
MAVKTPLSMAKAELGVCLRLAGPGRRWGGASERLSSAGKSAS